MSSSAEDQMIDKQTRSKERIQKLGTLTELYYNQQQINLNRSMVYTTQSTYVNQKKLIFLFLFAGVMIIVNILYMIYQVRQRYRDFIAMVTLATQQGYFSVCSGLKLAFSAHYPWFNWGFACDGQDKFANTATYMFYSKHFHDKVSTPQTLGTALTVLHQLYVVEPNLDIKDAICAVLDIKKGDPDFQYCANECQPQDNHVLDNYAESAMTGLNTFASMSMVCEGGGIAGMIFAGVAGLAAGLFSAYNVHKKRVAAQQQCEQYRQSCWEPPNFPPCTY